MPILSKNYLTLFTTLGTNHISRTMTYTHKNIWSVILHRISETAANDIHDAIYGG